MVGLARSFASSNFHFHQPASEKENRRRIHFYNDAGGREAEYGKYSGNLRPYFTYGGARINVNSSFCEIILYSLF